MDLVWVTGRADTGLLYDRIITIFIIFQLENWNMSRIINTVTNTDRLRLKLGRIRQSGPWTGLVCTIKTCGTGVLYYPVVILRRMIPIWTIGRPVGTEWLERSHMILWMIRHVRAATP